MNMFNRPLARLWACSGFTAVVFAMLSPAAQAVVTFEADPDVPTTFAAGTVDPLLFNVANRGIATNRQLRQTFQNPATINVGEIVIALDVSGPNAGFVIDLYEVADVNAATFTPLGAALTTITIPTTTAIPNTNERLKLILSGSDLFTLPQRDTGTEGYAIEFSNADGATTLGSLRHTNNGTDNYTAGRFYTESGGQSGNGDRDAGVWLIETIIEPPDPGDVDDDGDVDLDDLLAIRTNYYQSVTERIDGDLTGDLFVDSRDFREWKTAFLLGGGELTAADLSFLSAPEPTAVCLLLVGSMAAAVRKRR